MVDSQQPDSLDNASTDQNAEGMTQAEIAAEALYLSTVPERMGLIIDEAHSEKRAQITEWIHNNAALVTSVHWLNEAQRKAHDDTTPLTAAQVQLIDAWGPYCDLVMPRVDAIPGMVEREQALLGMYIDMALVHYDADVPDVYLDRLAGLTGYAIQLHLVDGVPQLRAIAARTGQPVDESL